jgi:hypothetical protein
MDVLRKSVDDPDEVVEFPNVRTDVVHLGDLTVGRFVNQPGWRWSEDVRPSVGGEWCQIRHVGFIVSGRLGIEFADGSFIVLGPGDVFAIPPGHDGHTVGDEPVVQIEWSGCATGPGWAVDATGFWPPSSSPTSSDPPRLHLASATGPCVTCCPEPSSPLRAELERFGGREVKTTGDGMLVTFDGSARALQCAPAVGRIAREHDLRLRIGAHVGEVELVGDDVRGTAVHEAARIIVAAGPDEILVSELARTLSAADGLAFEDRATHALKGLDGEWRLAAFVEDGSSPV